ncbi:MAG: hypothetical protein ACQEV0_11805 [Bacillota bacterium]
MKKTFETTREGRHIVVENRWFKGEKLFVDGQLQDENLGLSFSGVLNGKLKSMDGSKDIKATIGGFFTIQCKIFIDNELIYSSKG